MSDKIAIQTGHFCWHEVTTTDVKAGAGFYTKLFGWDMGETISDETMPYTVIRKDGISRGGMHPLTEELKSRSIPPNWLLYIAVDSVDTSAAKVKELGGQVLAGPGDVPQSGRFAVIQDPTGAVVALWEGLDVKGAPAGATHGDRTWCELNTNDTSVAGKFYTELIGWGTEVMPMGEGDYTCFKTGESMIGGMMKMPSGTEQMPSSWTTYFSTDNVDKSAALVSELGGSVIVPPADIPNVGRFAIVCDPQGAAFGIITYSEKK